MRLNYEINLQQQQKLLITPELRQAIAILLMSAPELEEYIDQEMEQNPFLEQLEESSSQEGEKAENVDDFGPREEVAEWAEYFLDRSDLGMTSQSREDRTYESTTSTSTTLQDHLNQQLRWVIENPLELRIGEYLVGCIDDRGYLAITLDEAALVLAVSELEVAKVLKIIQGFDPVGVGARDIRETMSIQLGHRGLDNPSLFILINEHLSDIAVGKLKPVAKALGISILELQDMCDLIKTLNPHPGNEFGGRDETRYIVPDIIVENINGEYIVSLNDNRVPGLRVNHLYQELLKHPSQFSHDEQKYMEDRLASAIWLIKSIEHRKLTLYRVVSCIVEMQKDFLDHGIHYLKPMTLKQVAEKVEVHESTVSRATTNKYVQTPRGVFELKFFFSSSLKGQDLEENVSARSTKRLISEIVESEDRVNPFSDQQICDLLLGQGITCSRRTVAKYRAELKIPQVTSRRRY
ncbi:MAG: RNA polymerase factor sigma-54 [Methylocystaceae bacterium]